MVSQPTYPSGRTHKSPIFVKVPFHGVKWGIRFFMKRAQLPNIAYYASNQFRSENERPLK